MTQLTFNDAQSSCIILGSERKRTVGLVRIAYQVAGLHVRPYTFGSASVGDLVLDQAPALCGQERTND